MTLVLVALAWFVAPLFAWHYFLDAAAMALLSSSSEEPYFAPLRAGRSSSFGPDSRLQPFKF